MNECVWIPGKGCEMIWFLTTMWGIGDLIWTASRESWAKISLHSSTFWAASSFKCHIWDAERENIHVQDTSQEHTTSSTVQKCPDIGVKSWTTLIHRNYFPTELYIIDALKYLAWQRELKRTVHPKMKIVSFYSPSCHPKQKMIFWETGIEVDGHWNCLLTSVI